MLILRIVLSIDSMVSHCSKMKTELLLRPLKMRRNFVFGCVLVFLFVFDAKSGTTNSTG